MPLMWAEREVPTKGEPVELLGATRDERALPVQAAEPLQGTAT